MPKFRSIHTKVIQSFDFNEMPDDFTRLAWLLLPLGLDCEGRGIYNASWVKAKIFPMREDVTNNKVMGAMEWYAARGMIQVYQADGHEYFVVLKFKDYQRGFEKESPSVLPAPLQSYSGVTPDQLQTSLPLNAHTQSYTQSHSQSDADAVPGEPGNDNELKLIRQFLDITKLQYRQQINGTKEGYREWTKTLVDLDQSGITEDIMRQAVNEMTARGYKIVDPGSIVKACNTVLAERARKEKGSWRKRDSEGEFADAIKH